MKNDKKTIQNDSQKEKSEELETKSLKVQTDPLLKNGQAHCLTIIVSIASSCIINVAGTVFSHTS